MPSAVTEARSICPELVEAVKLLDELAYTRLHSEVFRDLVNWTVWQHQFPPSKENPLDKYPTEKHQYFQDIFKIIQEEVKKRASLHTEGSPSWYDPFGRMYEAITSKNKSSSMGQYFTPKPVVDLMTNIQIQKGSDKGKFQSVFDPACGSGRMGLSAGVQLMANGNPCWVSMNDIDPICTKMTTANMCLNGIVGEALCSDGLDVTGKSYRFGYRVEPMVAQVPEPMRGLYSMAILAKTGQNINKMYVVKPIEYEQTYLKQVNETMLNELQERQKIANEEERTKAVQEIKDIIQQRMKGTLFENDTSQTENVDTPAIDTPTKFTSHRAKIQQEKDKPKPPDQQGKLF